MRASLLPDLVSCASVGAALAAADREDVLPGGALWRYFPGRRDPKISAIEIERAR